MKTLALQVVLLLMLGMPGLALGQSRVLYTVTAAGGGVFTGSQGVAFVTVGQPVAGVTGRVQTGFWHVLGEPTVDTEAEPPEAGGTLPRHFALRPTFPNPFQRRTQIVYDVPHAAHVRLEVLDVLGRRVAVLVDGARPAGTHRVSFEATRWSDGVYYVQMRTGDGFAGVRSLVVVR